MPSSFPKSFFLLVAVLTLGPWSATSVRAEAALRLSPEGTVIINHAPEEKGPRAAADLLQKWLRKASQSEKGFAIVSPEEAAKREAGARIVLNDPSVTLPEDFSDDGFVLKRIGDTIQIKGQARDATLYGAVALLHRLGVSFYLPGDLFTTLPKNPALEIGALDVSSTPYTLSVFFSGISEPEGLRWTRLNGVNRRKGGTHQHNSFAIFPPEKFAERYPEVYPLLDGKRYIPKTAKDQGWQPNFLAPQAVDAALESITAFFKENPLDRYVAVSIQDGHRFDQGPETTAVIDRYKASGIDSPIDRATSEIYWKFVTKLGNHLKTVTPGKQLVALAYGGTRFPPKDPLPDNIVVFTNFHLAEYPYGFDGPNKEHPEGLDAWLKVCQHYANHDWYQGSGFLMPRSYSGYWSDFLRKVAARVPDAYMHVESYPNWGFDGQKLYVLSRLLWDPSLDPKAVTKELANDLFGPAGQAMNAYFEIQEKLWNQLNGIEGPERKLFDWNRAFRTNPTSQALIADARKQLDAATAAAQTPEEKQRVALFSDCFGVSEIFFALAAQKHLDQAKVDAGSKTIQALIDKYGDMAMCHSKFAEIGLKKLALFVKQSDTPPYEPTSIPARETVLAPGDPLWDTMPVSNFTSLTGESDPRDSTIKIASDGSALYVLVRGPLEPGRKPVLDEGSTWRSDNVEFKFDINDDWGTREGHFWVKPNNRLVDWIDREDKNDSLISSEVVMTEDTELASIRIPYAYLKQTPGKAGQVGMQIFRNEFKELGTISPPEYSAIWTGKLNLDSSKP